VACRYGRPVSHELLPRDGRERAVPAERREPPAPEPGLTPGLVERLQRGAGNVAVGRMLAGLRTSKQFKADSKLTSGLITLPRSDELRGIDDALKAYERVLATGDLQASQLSLWALGDAIEAWRKSKATDDDKQAWKGSKRADEVADLAAEYQAELDALTQAMKDEDAENAIRVAATRRDRMDQLLPDALKVKPVTDTVTRARDVFLVFMNEFRGKAGYQTTTKKDVSIWDGGGFVACGMISEGLIDLLQLAGVRAKKRTIATKNFVTKRLTGQFIDPSAEGNVRLPGFTFADERRYFFNIHVIVEVADGEIYFDPTSGLEVTADAAEIVDFSGLESDGGGPPTYTDATHVLAPAGKNNRGDGAYEMRVIADSEDEETKSSSESS
jgi:hypothetical protein